MMGMHLKEILRTAVGFKSVSTVGSSLLPHALIAVSMSAFYGSRWLVGQTPPSTKGLIFPPEIFYGVSAALSIIVWPSMVELSARAVNALSKEPSDTLKIIARKRYAYPLFLWLGCVEFTAWLMLSPNLFRRVAPLLLLLAMCTVFEQFRHLLRTQQYGNFSACWRAFLALMPQLLVASLFIR